MIRALILVVALAACGDEITVDTTLEPVSGTRLKLEWYLFEDGTRQVEPHSFYDTEMHARCEPRAYVDGTTRCVPFADDAVYLDAGCETVVGRATAIAEPTHFIGYDRVAGELLPANVYAAGQPREAITEYYERRDGACEGPFPTAGDLTYYTITFDYDVLVLHEDAVGGERVDARLQLTDDGLRLPVELRDRARGAPCRPEVRTDGTVVCAPTAAAPATLFGDALCTTPVVTVPFSSPTPDVATRLDPAGCSTYHAVGAPYTGPIYEARGDTCTRIAITAPTAFQLGAALDLPVLDRTVEDEPGRRLQRITLADGELRILDDRMYDSATRADCRREVIAHTARCLPEATTPVVTRYHAGCALEQQVAEVPRRTCAPIAFATGAVTELGTELHAIGAPLAAPVFDLGLGGCMPYTASADHTLETVGPALGPDAFVRGVRYGER